MTTSTSAVPSLASLTSLLGKVLKQYESALKEKSISFYPSQVTIVPQEIAGPSKTTTIPWTIRCVPALLEKAKEKAAAKSQDKVLSTDSKGHQQIVDDVFAPPYHPGLLVEELPQHTVLLNKFCVVPRHFLLVTKEFQSQTLPPSPESLAIAYRILNAHHRLSLRGSPDVGKDKELMAFYNCGKVSGASQPHQHIQFAEFGGEDQGKPDADGGREVQSLIPVEELLDRITKDGKEEEHIHALPLPYQHFVCLLGRAPLKDDARLSDYLGMKLMSLLDALFKARLSAEMLSLNLQGEPKQRSSPSWNLLMTTRAMHLIPRQKEEFEGLKATATDAGKVDDGVELIGNLSVNSLGYAGHLLVKSKEELEALKSYPGGMTEVLSQTGVAPVEDITTDNGP